MGSRAGCSKAIISTTTLHIFDDRRDWRAAVLELFGAIGDLDACAPADVLVIGTFVCTLGSSPAAYVVDEHHLEIGHAGFHVPDQLLQRLAPIDDELSVYAFRPQVHARTSAGDCWQTNLRSYADWPLSEFFLFRDDRLGTLKRHHRKKRGPHGLPPIRPADHHQLTIGAGNG